MAVTVKEGIDYKLLDDNYRKNYLSKNRPIKTRKETIQGKSITVGYYRCMYCGHLVPHYQMEVDHIIPKTRLRAGIMWNPNNEWNLGPSCKTCNASKSNYLDERVLIGFKNKMLGKYGITAGDNHQFNSGDSGEEKGKIYGIMVLVYLITILSPIILLFMKGLELILHIGSKIFKGTMKTILIKYPKKIFRYIKKHPKKSLKITLAMAVVFYAASVMGVTWLDVTSYFQNALSTIMNLF